MQSKIYKLTELFLLFVLVPIVFALNIVNWLKASIGVLGFIYVVIVLIRVQKKKFKISDNINWKSFLKQLTIKFLFIAVITALFVWFFYNENFFIVVKEKPLLWLVFVGVYSLFSVYPQELIYRTFFFERYEFLIKNKYLFIFINAILFSLAHLFFKSSIVLFITFIGGLFFAYTYYKTKSTLLVTIEHAIYGSWLFTVGMGAMLGFPV